jgi:subtilisin family serine protease
MHPVETVRLDRLMAKTAGSPAVRIGLIDGPVDTGHPGFDFGKVQALRGPLGCARPDSIACQHGTFVAGILHARRGGPAPAICPECALVVRPIFTEGERSGLPTCRPHELAAAITDCVDAGVRLLNLSVGVLHATPDGEAALVGALDHAARRGAIVVAASGNQASIGGSVLARHAAVIPVVAALGDGRLAQISNFGASIGQRGLAAPGEGIESLSSAGGTRRFGGTSAAAPFVTGAAALLWSLFPRASAVAIRDAVTRATQRRTSIVPPLLDAQRGWDRLLAQFGGSR